MLQSLQLPELGKVGPATQRVFALIDSTPGIDVHKVTVLLVVLLDASYSEQFEASSNFKCRQELSPLLTATSS